MDPQLAELPGFVDRFPDLFQIAFTSSYKILGDRSKSEDVAQEALTRAMTRWEKVGSYAEPWISRVATNLAIDEWRKTRAVCDDDLEPGVPDHADAFVSRDELRCALLQLPRRQREAIVLRMLGGYSPEQAADAMGISPSGVLKHTTRALKALRETLGVERVSVGLRGGEDV